MSSTAAARAAVLVTLPLGAGKRAALIGATTALFFCALVVLVQRFDATVALGIAVLLGSCVAMLVRPEVATLLTVFLLYINAPAILTKQHGLPHILVGSFILLLGFPLAHYMIVRRERLRADRSFYLMLLLLAVLLVSSFAAVDRSMALDNVMEYALEGVLLYWLLLNVIRSLPTLRRIIWVMLCVGALLSALSLFQTLTGNYTNEFGGLAYRNYEVTQDEAARDVVVKRRTWDRAQGSLNEPNRFAQILVVLLPLAVYVTRNSRTRAARLGAVACGALIVAGIVLTLSRGAFVALIALSALLVAARWLRFSRLLVCAVLFLVMGSSVPFFTERMNGFTRKAGLASGAPATDAHAVDGAALGRATVMLAAFHVFLDHPIIGVGPGQFPPYYSQTYSEQPGIKMRDMPAGAWRAHSLYLEIAAETGIIGLVIFLAVVGTLLRRLWLARRHWITRNPELADLATAAALCVVTYHITGLFLHLSYQPYYWFLLAFAGAALHSVRPVALRDALHDEAMQERQAQLVAPPR